MGATSGLRIHDGELAPGQRMPSEKDLHDEFGFARETIRRALALLRNEGMVEVRHGHGTFVLQPPGQVALRPGDSATSTAAITATRADGTTEVHPTGTIVTVAGTSSGDGSQVGR
ncbi:GntR family transcriptional regulator [Actinoplanes sp. NPDC048988]|uniref:GntR family transcriptional regulator n=1 Tax=Actinoplanes sp. NPDC048988 TaxID=3363901 RepID=UPI003717ECC6